MWGVKPDRILRVGICRWVFLLAMGKGCAETTVNVIKLHFAIAKMI